MMDNPIFRFVKEDICDRDAVCKLFEEEHPNMVAIFVAESHVDRSTENSEISLCRPTFLALRCWWMLASSTEFSAIIR